MKKIQVLILAIFVLPFALYGAKKSDLPYDYIDSAEPVMTKKNLEKVIEHNAILLEHRKEPNGFFVGIGGMVVKPFVGRTIGGNFNINGNTIRLYYEQNPTEIDGGLNLLAGYKWFFGMGTLGLRLYVDYTARFLNIYNPSNNSNSSLNSHSIATNLDMLLNFVKTQPFKFGMIVGVGAGGVFEKLDSMAHLGESNISNPTANLNLGFRFVIFNHSAIEVLGQGRFTIPKQEQCNVKIGNMTMLSSDCKTTQSKEISVIGNFRFVYTF